MHDYHYTRTPDGTVAFVINSSNTNPEAARAAHAYPAGTGGRQLFQGGLAWVWVGLEFSEHGIRQRLSRPARLLCFDTNFPSPELTSTKRAREKSTNLGSDTSEIYTD